MAEVSILEVVDLTQIFEPSGGLFGRGGKVRAVNGINFAIPAGQTLALVGESGCGKTTTIKLVLRLLKPTDGTVRFKGRDIWEMTRAEIKQFRQSVQAVFQDPWASLNPHMRVREIVAEPLIVVGGFTKAERQRRVDEVLEAVGLRSEHADNYPHEFSGGQRQRIAIATALSSRPELMVLDEPVSALDVSIRAQIMNLFKEIQERYGVSYLVVAHDLGTTRFLADDVSVMYLGRIVENGPADKLFRDPRHPYTEALLSAALKPDPDMPDKEIVLSGEQPSPINPPPGCAFHPRCHRLLDDRCEAITPPVFTLDGETRHVACFRAEGATSDVMNAG
ncbi:MAG: oligopeptide/dipeptide ABC transporter ATP-binding protein [Pseudomonadota bacterium]